MFRVEPNLMFSGIMGMAFADSESLCLPRARQLKQRSAPLSGQKWCSKTSAPGGAKTKAKQGAILFHSPFSSS